jgi:hypothetical protein
MMASDCQSAPWGCFRSSALYCHVR